LEKKKGGGGGRGQPGVKPLWCSGGGDCGTGKNRGTKIQGRRKKEECRRGEVTGGVGGL